LQKEDMVEKPVLAILKTCEKNFHFYLPYMEYGGSIGLGFSVCHAPLPFAKICTAPTASPLQARKLKFWLP
jgi:hypothetical protein